MMRRGDPSPRLGERAAARVRAELDIHHPTEAPIEAVAHLRGATVRPKRSDGAQATLVRLGGRAIIGVATGLTPGQRRFAIAHELGHFEMHAHLSYLGLCTGEDLLPAYRESGREAEANEFAAELLMPAALLRPRCDVERVRWDPIEELEREFEVSLTAAAIRFLNFTPDRVALVCSRAGEIEWVIRTTDFGHYIPKGQPLDKWSLAHDFFAKGSCSARPEEVSASAWLPDVSDRHELVEHTKVMPNYGIALSLLWIRADADF